MNLIPNYKQWATLPADEAARIAQDLQVPARFTFAGIRQSLTGMPIATYQDSLSGLRFNLLPGGEYQKGLSSGERQQAAQLPACRMDVLDDLPVAQTVSVEPFFISQTPLQSAFVSKHVELSDELFRPEFGDDEDDPVAIYMSHEELRPILERFHWSLPTEAQMEFALRGGTPTLFWFGSALPDASTLGKEILATVFDEATVADPAKANPFGLYGSLVGCWCSDVFESGAARTGHQGHVIKGGGAVFWPWQDGSEWMLCMSAMRMSSQDLEDETCAAFVVVPLS